MHEISLAGGILQLVEDSARRDGFKRVTLLRLEVGRLANVELHALQFALAAIAPGTLLEGAELAFAEPAGQAWCANCSQTVPMAERGMACPLCGGYRLQPNGGLSLRVIDMLVADD
jgi:hydrogenase nickel incorporation protein HypA/HybF